MNKLVATTYGGLLQDLRELGVESGDILFVHSSFKSLGPVEGGVETVVRTLSDCLGPAGLLLMPSFNMVDMVPREERAATWDIRTTPSTVGWITEYFRRLPDTYRSDHYSHSVAARGKEAKDFVAGHLSQEGYPSPWDCAPWGKTYGVHSPMYRAWQAGGRLLMLGVDYVSSTYIHLVEVLCWHQLRTRDPEAAFPVLKRPELGAFWDRTGELKRGVVGDADCRLFQIDQYIAALLAEVQRDPAAYLR